MLYAIGRGAGGAMLKKGTAGFYVGNSLPHIMLVECHGNGELYDGCARHGLILTAGGAGTDHGRRTDEGRPRLAPGLPAWRNDVSGATNAGRQQSTPRSMAVWPVVQKAGSVRCDLPLRHRRYGYDVPPTRNSHEGGLRPAWCRRRHGVDHTPLPDPG
ncbi:hypothetical protein CFR77_13715 [Komagataeibacter sucrofermentans]|uniref:Uncharacterized protein n=1 Tax=Komagataeibacter sucrofermentans TaxID=1053551 RepID=A0A318QXY5_9PROT|nr:hypothetical protein CFR77_13715 [Komagataeibacter sucrofermentans]GBQ46055.1 hypothetical protein AA15973_0791 [Komagataeibacter sucrofermentans DSM 15973]